MFAIVRLSLKFASEARSLHLEWIIVRTLLVLAPAMPANTNSDKRTSLLLTRLHLKGRLLYQTKMEATDSDKHIRLLRYIINYSGKSFLIQALGHLISLHREHWLKGKPQYIWFPY